MELSNQFQRYIANQLSPEDQTRLETAIQTDPAVRSEYESHLTLHRGIAEQEKALLKSGLQQLHGRQVQRKRWMVRGLVALLLLAVSLLSLWWWSRPAPTPLPSYYAEAYPNVVHPVTRSTPSDVYNQAFWLYEAGRYEEAVEQFALLRAEKQESSLSFYQAMSLFNAEDYAAAQVLLEELEQTKEAKFLPEVRWYLALVYYQADEVAKAKSMLLSLRSSGADFKEAEVELLLQTVGE